MTQLPPSAGRPVPQRKSPAGAFVSLLTIALLVGAIGLFVGGLRAYRIGVGSSSVATKMELADLEKSPNLTNNHLELGPHVRLFDGAVYEYETVSGAKPDRKTKVTRCYYPIVSQSHPFRAAWQKLIRKYGKAENVPANAYPAIQEFSVLVKTFKFKTIGAIPSEPQDSRAIKGLVVNAGESLGSQEKELIRESYPHVDFDKVLILQEGATPTPVSTAIAMMAGGGVCALAFLVLVVIIVKKVIAERKAMQVVQASAGTWQQRQP